MKRILTLVFMFVALALFTTSCNRSTCPTFDENAADKSLQGGGKTKSGIYPKDMEKQMKKGK